MQTTSKGSGDSSYYVYQDSGEHVGPVTLDLLARGITSGKVPRNAQVSTQGKAPWRPALSVADIAKRVSEIEKKDRRSIPPMRTIPPALPPPPLGTEPDLPTADNGPVSTTAVNTRLPSMPNAPGFSHTANAPTPPNKPSSLKPPTMPRISTIPSTPLPPRASSAPPPPLPARTSSRAPLSVRPPSPSIPPPLPPGIPAFVEPAELDVVTHPVAIPAPPSFSPPSSLEPPPSYVPPQSFSPPSSLEPPPSYVPSAPIAQTASFAPNPPIEVAPPPPPQAAPQPTATSTSPLLAQSAAPAPAEKEAKKEDKPPVVDAKTALLVPAATFAGFLAIALIIAVVGLVKMLRHHEEAPGTMHGAPMSAPQDE